MEKNAKNLQNHSQLCRYPLGKKEAGTLLQISAKLSWDSEITQVLYSAGQRHFSVDMHRWAPHLYNLP